MTRMTVEQLKELRNFDYSYSIVERVGHDKAAFYYAASEYEDYQKEVARAMAADVLVSYGAKFRAR
jgi:hypothetical protein